MCVYKILCSNPYMVSNIQYNFIIYSIFKKLGDFYLHNHLV